MTSTDAGFGEPIDEAQKELVAILTMRTMLEDYAKKRSVPFSDALLAFARTPAFEALFNFSTRLWAEGPAYLMEMFEADLAIEVQA